MRAQAIRTKKALESLTPTRGLMNTAPRKRNVRLDSTIRDADEMSPWKAVAWLVCNLAFFVAALWFYADAVRGVR
jgi:hypothetical protein